MSLTVRVIAPDKTVWDANAQEVILPSTTGQLGILPGHAPLLTALDIGVMRVQVDKNWLPIALMGGFAEVEENELTVLVNGAELGSAIDAEAAKTAYSDTQANLDKARASGTRQEQLQANQAMKRARARLQAATGVVTV